MGRHRYVGHGRRAIEEWELQELLSASRSARARVVYLLAADAGLRRAEALDVSSSDVLPTRIHVRHGKGRVSRWTVNTERIQAAIAAVGHLPVDRCYSWAGFTFEKDRIRAGLAADLSLHCLRHRFAQRLLEAGVNLIDIQALLGHRDLATTAVYLHDSPARFERARLAIQGEICTASFGIPSLNRQLKGW